MRPTYQLGMQKLDSLRAYGLFDAKVPRYTSYPPANRFLPDIGRLFHRGWLASTVPDRPVSIYVHIPFCRRLCWFCACRTQGTRTLAPVEAYLQDLSAEIAQVARILPDGVSMARLHLGGGTPTLLSAAQLDRLLTDLYRAFPRSPDFELSVEIDPTEAADTVLETLGRWKLARASIGVQDFAPHVQKAIGRQQSFALTQKVAQRLRACGVNSLNVDLLYGLPGQTDASLLQTLDLVSRLAPDRLALYGYAHVPHVSKRQVMIPADSLPDAEARLQMSELARDRLVAGGFLPLGIDHFARPNDSLARAARAGTMRRNFQGYTDDTCATLIGLGASAISRFPEGYVQNAVATGAYRKAVAQTGSAASKGYALGPEDNLLADVIDALMCTGGIVQADICARYPNGARQIQALFQALQEKFPLAVRINEGRLEIRPGFAALTRVIAAYVDGKLTSDQVHSMAV